MKKYIILILTLSISCQNHKMYYDIRTQELRSCNNIPFRKIDIKGEVSLIWKDSINKPPDKLDLNHIPNGYELTDGVKKLKSFNLSPHRQYDILKFGQGLLAHSIRIWTDSVGRVYKSTHPDCDCNGGVSKDWAS